MVGPGAIKAMTSGAVRARGANMLRMSPATWTHSLNFGLRFASSTAEVQPRPGKRKLFFNRAGAVHASVLRRSLLTFREGCCEPGCVLRAGTISAARRPSPGNASVQLALYYPSPCPCQ